MRLTCPKCARAIEGVDIDLAKGLGVCRPCGELVPIGHVVTPFAGGASLARTTDGGTRTLYRPESLRLVEKSAEGRYEASLPPRRLAAIPLVGFCLVWNTFMAVWYGIAIAGGIWPMALFGLLHLGAGIFLTHKALVELFNTRRLVIAGGTVSWTSGPIPTRANLSVGLDEIDGFGTHVKATQKTTAYLVALNLRAGTMREIDIGASDLTAAEYAAECFQDALAEAKRLDPKGPYRT